MSVECSECEMDARGRHAEGCSLAPKKNNRIMLRCPHCEQSYEAEIGNNPLVRDALTITPLPLPPEIEVETEN